MSAGCKLRAHLGAWGGLCSSWGASLLGHPAPFGSPRWAGGCLGRVNSWGSSCKQGLHCLCHQTHELWHQACIRLQPTYRNLPPLWEAAGSLARASAPRPAEHRMFKPHCLFAKGGDAWCTQVSRETRTLSSGTQGMSLHEYTSVYAMHNSHCAVRHMAYGSPWFSRLA